LTGKFSRLALITAAAVGVSGLVAVPAADALGGVTGTQVPGYVNQPIAANATNITPESAVISGAVDTGGYTAGDGFFGTGYSEMPTSTLWDAGVSGTGLPVTPGTAITVDGLPITTSDLNGNQVPTYSAVWVEYDPLSDWTAAGDIPGPETQFAPEEDVDTTTAPYNSFAPIKLGGYPSSVAQANGNTPLTPGTTYVYWVEQQVGETTAAETINEFNPVDLYNFLDQTSPSGSGATAGTGGTSAASLFGEAGDGPASGDPFYKLGINDTALSYSGAPADTNATDGSAWLAGSGIYGANGMGAANLGILAGKIGYTDALGKSETLNLTSLANPDWQCAADATIKATDTTGQPWETYADGGTVSGGIASVTNGAIQYAGAEPEFQGGAAAGASCVDFLASTANQNFFVTSATGEFTTSKLGNIVFAGKATVKGAKATVKVTNQSGEDAVGSVSLTAKVKGKTVALASGGYRVAAHGVGSLNLKISKKGAAALKTAKKGTISTTLVLTSNTDQKTTSKKVTL
jgi:hypothetical protein